MSKNSNARSEILSMVAAFVQAHEDRELRRDIFDLFASGEFMQLGDFSSQINLQLDVFARKVPEETESINKIRIKVLELFGCEVFESKTKFLRWMSIPNRALGN